MLPRTKEQNEAMKIETRHKIQTVATKLFAEQGFAATGVQEIADAAGISVGLLYRHYKTKDEIFGALVELGVEGLIEVGTLFSSDLSPIEIVTSFVNEIVRDISTGYEFVHFMLLMNQPFVSHERYAWMDLLWEQNQIFLNQITATIDKGQSIGQFKTGDTKQMAQYLLATILGICMMKLAAKESFAMPTAEILMAFLI